MSLAAAWDELRTFVGSSNWIVTSVDGETATLKFKPLTAEQRKLLAVAQKGTTDG